MVCAGISWYPTDSNICTRVSYAIDIITASSSVCPFNLISYVRCLRYSISYIRMCFVSCTRYFLGGKKGSFQDKF